MGEAAAVIGTAITTLGLIAVAIIREGRQAQNSKREGVEGDGLQSQSSSNETREGFRSLVQELREEVGRLREDRTEDRDELAQLRVDMRQDRESHTTDMDEMRVKHAAVVEENRHFRNVILGVLERLRRVPPLDHSEIATYIIQAIPGLGRTDL